VSVLERILAAKRLEVERLRRDPGEPGLLAAAREGSPPRGFGRALREAAPPRVIAEFKRASPSRGKIASEADAGRVAAAYAAAGAAALSVLTDAPFFGGSLEDLGRAREACSLPVLRKDFLIDPIQAVEARAAGADAILLIVAALDDARLRDLLQTAEDLGLDALVEVHRAEELERALEAEAEIVGINNRDLNTFRTDVAVTRALLPRAAGRTVVSESGLRDAATLHDLAAAGVHAFLIGEALMRNADPGAALRALREPA
jgi:indole-3-glycerol phosphate synthase